MRNARISRSASLVSRGITNNGWLGLSLGFSVKYSARCLAHGRRLCGALGGKGGGLVDLGADDSSFVHQALEAGGLGQLSAAFHLGSSKVRADYTVVNGVEFHALSGDCEHRALQSNVIHTSQPSCISFGHASHTLY